MTNILMVEDDAAICKALSMGLSLKDSHLDVAQDGNTGIMLGKQKSYDILLADLGLPDMDGLEVISHMKRLCPDIVPIVITGNRSLKSSIEAIRLDVSDYLLKPLDLASVEESITQGLKKRAARKKENEQKLQVMFEDYQKQLITTSAMPDGNKTITFPQSLGMLVHQINNPLTTILTNAEMAMSNLDNNKSIRNQLKGIIRATESISRINGKIIAIEKPVDYRQEKFDIKDVMIKSLAMFESLLDINKIELVMEWTKHDCIVAGDQFSIEQVFKNLILNAIEAMDGLVKRRPALTIMIHMTATLIKVRIRDNGEGIRKDHLDKIYAPYFTTKKKGMGLGLPVIKQILEEHQSTIKVNSKWGQGTEFTITLPRKESGPYYN